MEQSLVFVYYFESGWVLRLLSFDWGDIIIDSYGQRFLFKNSDDIYNKIARFWIQCFVLVLSSCLAFVLYVWLDQSPLKMKQYGEFGMILNPCVSFWIKVNSKFIAFR